jgi:hypothetical protein
MSRSNQELDRRISDLESQILAKKEENALLLNRMRNILGRFEGLRDLIIMPDTDPAARDTSVEVVNQMQMSEGVDINPNETPLEKEERIKTFIQESVDKIKAEIEGFEAAFDEAEIESEIEISSTEEEFEGETPSPVPSIAGEDSPVQQAAKRSKQGR